MSEDYEDVGLFELEPRRPIDAGDEVRFTTLLGQRVTGKVTDVASHLDGTKTAMVVDAEGVTYAVLTTSCTQVHP